MDNEPGDGAVVLAVGSDQVPHPTCAGPSFENDDAEGGVRRKVLYEGLYVTGVRSHLEGKFGPSAFRTLHQAAPSLRAPACCPSRLPVRAPSVLGPVGGRRSRLVEPA